MNFRLQSFFLVIIIITVLFGCKDTSEKHINFSDSGSLKNVYEINTAANIVNIDKSVSVNREIIRLKENTIFEGCSFAQVRDLFAVVSMEEAKIFIFSKNFELKDTISVKGKGPNQIEHINAFSISDGNIYLLNYNQRKVLKYNTIKKTLEEYSLPKNGPYYINSFVVIDPLKILCTGIDYDGFYRMKGRKEYSNIFLIEFEQSRVLSKYSFLPENIIKAIKEEDYIASPVTSPFFIVRDSINVFLFNKFSNVLFIIPINEIGRSYEEIKLGYNFFKLHPALPSRKQLIPNKVKNWAAQGSFFNNIFQINGTIVFYISNLVNDTEDNIVQSNYFIFYNTTKKIEHLLFTSKYRLLGGNNDAFYFIENSFEESSKIFKIYFNKLF